MFKNQKTPEFWHRANLIASLLVPFSLVYFLIKRIISSFSPKPISFNSKIICVGNIVAGGAGKTPVVLAMYELLSKEFKDKKIVILSKGYMGKISEPTIVDNQTHKAQDVGDEAFMISQYATCVVSSDRLKGVQFCEEQGFDIIVTDDGLHDGRIKKDLSFIVIDGGYGFGNNLVMPAGPLRDRFDYAVADADSVILIGKDELDSVKVLERRTRKKYKVFPAEIEAKDKIDRKLIYTAFAGLGRPEKFFNYLKDVIGAVIIKDISYADHYDYNKDDEEFLETIAEKEKSTLITTEKDFVKLSEDFQKKVICYKISLDFSDDKKLLKHIKGAIK